MKSEPVMLDLGEVLVADPLELSGMGLEEALVVAAGGLMEVKQECYPGLSG